MRAPGFTARFLTRFRRVRVRVRVCARAQEAWELEKWTNQKQAEMCVGGCTSSRQRDSLTLRVSSAVV